MHLRHQKKLQKENPSALCALMAFIIFLIHVLAQTVDAASCDILFPKEDGPTIVRTINQGSDLNKFLSEGNIARNRPGQNNFSNILLKLNVINGTIWLSQSGDVGKFSPVLGLPPATSSDISLVLAMQKLSEIRSNPLPRVLLSYEPEEIGDWSKDAITSYAKVIPTWSSSMYSSNDVNDYDVLLTNNDVNQEQHRNASSNSLMDSFRLAPNRKYGLDVVFDRVRTEDILMLFDFNRIKKILTTFFVRSGVSGSDEAISDPDALYLRRKYRTIERNHKNTFTELFLSNLVHLLPDTKGANGGEFGYRPQGRNKRKRPRSKIEFLPDLQQTDVFYSKEDIENLKTFLRKNMLHKSACILVEVRAGIFLQNKSLLNLAEVLNDKELDFQLYVRSEPYDTLLDVNALSSAIKIVGENRLVVDFPTDLHTKLKMLSTQIRHPNTNLGKNIGNGIERSDNILKSSGSTNTSCIVLQLYHNTHIVLLILFAILKIFL